jgi:hypothetical protein
VPSGSGRSTDELADVRATLDSRYDDLKSGRVKPIGGDEVIARLRAKSAARSATEIGSSDMIYGPKA